MRPSPGRHIGLSRRRALALPARTAVVVAALSTALFSAISSAYADSSVDGVWKQGPLVETFTVQQWLAGCGPEPSSTRSGGGESATIREEGDELVILAGGRTFRTNECYDGMPNLRRETHSRDPSGKSWRTRCTTLPNDPRKATLNTLVARTTDNHLEIVETGRYEVTLETGRCMADVKRTRSLDRIGGSAPIPTASEAPAKSPEPRPQPAARTCEAPGPPVSLEVRPSRKLLRTGSTFVFRARVVDAKGCATHTPTTWRIEGGAKSAGLDVDRDGRLTISNEAAEGTVELVASAAGKSARVVVEISEPAHYDALLARSGLNAEGENDAASVVALESQSIGAGETSVEDRAKGRRVAFSAIVLGAIILLGGVALVFWRRGRRAQGLEREAMERHEARVRDALEERRRREAEHADRVRAHEESLAASAARRAERAKVPAPAMAKLSCPTCGRSWADGTTYCPHDGIALVAGTSTGATTPPGPPSPVDAARGKICPTCGDTFDRDSEYCGKDGTQLVLVN